ncbi:MAG: sugar phosphate isomerase/epimerase [Planctomycetes bacterium]|nr:sugar phosphate isomerase/epimerase [Planctomycetota bacterium]
MARIKLGVCLASLGLPLRRGLEEARRLGLTAVELRVGGELSPTGLSQTGRRELRQRLRSHGLELAAVSCPLRFGFDRPERLEERIDHVSQCLSLSYDLGGPVVVVQTGRVSAEKDDPRAAFLAESLQALARHGDRVGAVLALETGLEAGRELAEFLVRFDTGSLAVCYDPANLLMNGFDPYQSARDLKERLAHAHARDARSAGASRASMEVALGHGDIDWLLLASVLEEVGFHGCLAIARETGDNRVADVASGAAFLRRLFNLESKP